jgi:hypothetical protein
MYFYPEDLNNNIDIVYEDRIVAFIDILGFKNIIKESTNNEVIIKQLNKIFNNLQFDKNERFTKQSLHENKEFPNCLFDKKGNHINHPLDKLTKRKMTIFSDSIVISYPIKENNFNYLMNYLVKLSFELSRIGFMVRGGIVFGKLYHKKNIVLGDALIQAYELESKNAIYPRIIISEETIEKYYSYIQTTATTYLKKDIDNYYFVDFLSNNIYFRNPLKYKMFLAEQFLFYKKQTLKTKDKKIIKKINWKIEYIENTFIDVNTICNDNKNINECCDLFLYNLPKIIYNKTLKRNN